MDLRKHPLYMHRYHASSTEWKCSATLREYIKQLDLEPGDRLYNDLSFMEEFNKVVLAQNINKGRKFSNRTIALGLLLLVREGFLTCSFGGAYQFEINPYMHSSPQLNFVE